MMFLGIVIVVMLCLHNSKTLRQKVGTKRGHCFDRSDHSFVWKKVDLGTLGLECSGMLKLGLMDYTITNMGDCC